MLQQYHVQVHDVSNTFTNSMFCMHSTVCSQMSPSMTADLDVLKLPAMLTSAPPADADGPSPADAEAPPLLDEASDPSESDASDPPADADASPPPALADAPLPELEEDESLDESLEELLLLELLALEAEEEDPDSSTLEASW